MHEQGTRLAGEITEDLESFLRAARGRPVPWAQARIFATIIRRNIRLAECPSHGVSIFEYAPRSNGAADYLRLARELIDPASVLVTGDDGPCVAAGELDRGGPLAEARSSEVPGPEAESPAGATTTVGPIDPRSVEVVAATAS